MQSTCVLLCSKLLADEEEPPFLAACESPLTNAGVEITKNYGD